MAWSNPELLALTKSFVPAADEVWRLQNGDDFECRLFQRFSEEGHYREHATTRQGIYVASPSGRFLGSTNSRIPARIAAMLRESLERWAELPPESRGLNDAERKELRETWRGAIEA